MKKFDIRDKFSQIRWNKEFCQEYFGVDPEELLCLWVADSDIPLPNEINDLIVKRAQYPYYGYHIVDKTFKEDFVEFHKNFRNQTVNYDETFITTGTVFSYAMLIQIFSKENENLLFHIPIYSPLVKTAKGLNRNAILTNYKLENNTYNFDFEEFEKTIVENNIKLYTLVSPMNPSGRIWTYEELLKIVGICKKHDVFIISDEIHCDIIFNDHKFTSMLEFSEIYKKIVVISSINKSFNIPGMQIGWGICKDKEIHKEIKEMLEKNHVSQSPNVFAQVAMQACFKNGKKYLKDTIEIFEKNAKYIKDYFAKNCPELEMFDIQSTYLPYVCFEKTNIDLEQMKELIWKQAKVLVQFNDDFFEEDFKCFRINVASDFEVIKEACMRITKVVNEFINK